MRAYLLPDKRIWSHRTFAPSEAQSLFVLHAPFPNMLSSAPCCGRPLNLVSVVTARSNRSLCDALRQKMQGLATGNKSMLWTDELFMHMYVSGNQHTWANLFLRYWGVPMQRRSPSTMIPMRVHNASHSSYQRGNGNTMRNQQTFPTVPSRHHDHSY